MVSWNFKQLAIALKKKSALYHLLLHTIHKGKIKCQICFFFLTEFPENIRQLKLNEEVLSSYYLRIVLERE